MSKGDIDQAGGGSSSKSSSDDLHLADGDSKTWGHWAAEKAPERVAASKPPSIAEPANDINAKNANVASGDKTMSVQDSVDHHSSTIRAATVGQKSTTKGLIDAGLTRAAMITAQARNIAETLRQNISAFTPGDGDKELADTITAFLSSLPTLLKEKVWRSSSLHKKEKSLNSMPTPTNSDFSQEDATTTATVSGLEDRVAGAASSATGARCVQQVEHQQVEPKAGEEKLDPIGPKELRELRGVDNGTLDCEVDNAPIDSENLSPQSPKTLGSTSAADAIENTKVQDEANADDHRSRVMPEAHVYLEAELIKGEAHAQKMHAKAESQRLQEEAKARETFKKEELRAESLVHNAEVTAEKLLAEAKSKAASIGATAEEEYTRTMDDAKTKAERLLAEIEESKQRQIAELHDRVEEMILMREFPLPRPQRKKESVVKKVKEKVKSHIRGY